MKRTLKTLGLAVMLVVGSNAYGQQVWDCRYDGEWGQDADGSGGSFIWLVRWTGAIGGWEVYGDYRDGYGDSYLDGTCDNSSCALKQVYTNGALAGREYYWLGEYAEETISATRVINAFSGTWGRSLTQRDGAWEAIAVCDRVQ